MGQEEGSGRKPKHPKEVCLKLIYMYMYLSVQKLMIIVYMYMYMYNSVLSLPVSWIDQEALLHWIA